MHTEDFTQANEVQQLLGRLRSTCEGKQFSDVPERANPHLALVTADVSTQTKVEFPNMAPLYWGDSDSVNPAMYVRASMSIPGFFYPLRIAGVPQGMRREQGSLARITPAAISSAELVIEPPALLGSSEQTTTGASRTSSGR